MNRNIIISLISLSVLFFSCGKKTVIQGRIKDAENANLVIAHFNAGKPIKLDQKKLGKDGTFKFSVSAMDTTAIYSLRLDGTKVIRLVVKPEEQLIVNTTKTTFGKAYEVAGSEESKLLQEAETKLWSAREELAEIRMQYSKTKAADAKKELEKKYETIVNKHYEYLRHFVFDNANSLVAYLALYQKIDNENFVFGNYNDDKYVRAVAQKMKVAHPNSRYLPLLLQELKRRSTEKQNLKIQALIKQTKNSYPELNLENAKGAKISLKATKAKYALLWFGVLNEASKTALLPLYEKYHKKGLEIYFVDENPNKKTWKEALVDLQTPWINVHDASGIGAATYNVQRIPTNYIIEVAGTIEGKDLFGAYLSEKFAKIF